MSTSENHEKTIFILVVEDSKTQAVQISYFLENNNYSVHVCFDGQEAYEWLKSVEKKPDVIISDVMMPKMDGYELCKAIRSDKNLKDIPVLLLTTLSDPSDIMKSIEAGANKFMTKPYNSKILPMTINELYLNAKKRKEEHKIDGIDLTYGGKNFLITADKTQILDLLMSSYESAYYQNVELQEARSELEKLNAQLEKKVQERTKELRVQEEKFRTLTENSPDIIIRYNKNKEIIYVNRNTENIKDIECSALIGEPVVEKIESESDICACVGIVDEILKSGIRKQYEYILSDINGDRWFDSLFVPEFNEKGEIEYVLNVSREITEQKNIEKLLKEKEEMMISQSRQAAMGNMISMIAHQWRQPLTIISMINNNIILDRELGNELKPEKIEESAKKSSMQIEYLNKTIEDFRNFFKPNREKIQMSIPETINKSLGLIEHSLINHNIKVTKECNSDNKIMMFPNELMQVFINLINNSKDAIIQSKIKEGQISISCWEDAKYVITKVKDNGGGIPEDASSKIGEMNFTTKGEDGTGLGIYMSKMIVEKHLKGTLAWQNEDDGASFIVSIPYKMSILS